MVAWYREEHLPRLCGVEGTLRARLYHADAGISNIVTAERRVHGASSGTQEFMAMYELLNLDIRASKGWRDVARGREDQRPGCEASRQVAVAGQRPGTHQECFQRLCCGRCSDKMLLNT